MRILIGIRSFGVNDAFLENISTLGANCYKMIAEMCFGYYEFRRFSSKYPHILLYAGHVAAARNSSDCSYTDRLCGIRRRNLRIEIQ